MYSSMGYSNGYHNHQQQQPQQQQERMGGITSQRERGRRGGRRSRDSLRVSEHQQQNERKPATPCTDFDVAYFHSYAHVGIHEEMIKELARSLFASNSCVSYGLSFLVEGISKDRVRTETYRAAIMQNQSSIEGKVISLLLLFLL
ncbi:hypothetical protein Pint_23260 [Pistacia integerrima]|uniref:Uncharacterized protein n=1 Tax=Pistacia integerrima TaxID=434235 RepID=A0ACC0YJ31_9ROSI|nr:hypothetical protein Pint_23260 [Pistacia integerrima]